MTSTTESGLAHDAPLHHIEYDPPVPLDLPSPTIRTGGRRLVESALAVARHAAPQTLRAVTRRADGYNPFVRAARLACGDLGATYVKFGQFVGSAPDIVGDAIAGEFRFCMDAGPPIPFDDVRRTMGLLGVKSIADLTRDHVDVAPA